MSIYKYVHSVWKIFRVYYKILKSCLNMFYDLEGFTVRPSNACSKVSAYTAVHVYRHSQGILKACSFDRTSGLILLLLV